MTADEPGSLALRLLGQPSRIAEDLAVMGISASTDRVEGLIRSEAVARYAGFLIGWEALARRTLEAQRRLVWGAWGLPVGADVTRLQERISAVEACGAASPRPRRGGPLVHWHERGRGPALLLLNGWTASGLMWPQAFIERLERRFHVIRPDNRGSGWSRSAPAPFSIADMADDAAAILKAVARNQATVVGLSMGGMIAQELAIRHRPLVRRLIIAGSRPPTPAQLPPTSPSLLSSLLSRPRGMPAGVHVATTWAGFCAPGFAEQHAELLDQIVAHVLRRPTPRHLMLQQARAVVAWSGPRRLARITAPTVVVHGDADPLMPVGNGMRLARLIAGARYVELAGVGHVIPFEAPDRLAEVIEEELSSGAGEPHRCRGGVEPNPIAPAT